MAVVTVEVEVASSLPAATLAKLFNNFDTLAPKIEPGIYQAISTIEGDGGVGSIKSVTYGEGVPFTHSKHKIDSFEPESFSYGYTVFDGDILMGKLDSANHQITFIPSADGGAVYKHTVVNNCKDDNGIPEDIINLMKQQFTKTFKDFEAYAIANPEAY